MASPNGAKRAIAAGLGSIEYVVSAADGHSRANVGPLHGGSDRADPRDRRDRPRQRRHRSRSSSPPRGTARSTGRRHPSGSLDVVTAACDADVDRLAIADTIGTTTPRRVSDLIARIRPLIGDIPLGAHFHNTRGAGLASAYAAVSSGVTRLDASVGGLGGCPFAPGASGNIATEDLVYLLRDSGIHVDVDLQAAIAAARVAQNAVGHDLPSSLLRAGDRILGDVDTCPPRRSAPRAARPGRPSSRPPGSCSPSVGFTAPRWPTSPRRRANRLRCSTATSPTKKTCWPRWPQSFLHDVVTPSGLSLHLPDSPDDDASSRAVVTGYWNMFKQNIGIMIAVAQLAATQPRFAAVQNEFRRFGMDIVAASVRRAQEQGYGAELDPEHTAAAIALLFENFTTVFVGTSGLGLEISDEDAIATLSRIWKKTLYGF